MEFENEIENDGFSEEEFRDVNECITNLLSTIAGEQGLDRDFGIDTNGITDVSAEEAENLLTIEIVEKNDRYEPRVEVDDIEFTHDDTGKLIPKIYFKKREAEDEES